MSLFHFAFAHLQVLYFSQTNMDCIGNNKNKVFSIIKIELALKSSQNDFLNTQRKGKRGLYRTVNLD